MRPVPLAYRGMKCLTRCLLALLLVALFAATVEACPTCKVALASHDKGQGDLVSGFFWSILFLLSMPFLLLGSFSAYCYLLVKKARSQAASGHATPGAQRVTRAPELTQV